MLVLDPPLEAEGGEAGSRQQPSRGIRRLLIELLLVPAGYLAYAAVRNARGETTPAKTQRALADANRLIRLEQRTGLYHERAIQHALLHAPVMIRGLDVFYATAHFVVTLAVLVFLYWRAPQAYPKLRTALGVATGLALIGFAVFPVMPPRLLPPNRGFVDTLQTYGGVWSFKTPVIERISDPFAALPSLHLAWASWCAIAMRKSFRNRWLRGAAILYPVVSALTVLGTANHYILDIVAGLAITAVGLLVAELPSRIRLFLASRAGQPRPQVGGGRLLES